MRAHPCSHDIDVLAAEAGLSLLLQPLSGKLTHRCGCLFPLAADGKLTSCSLGSQPGAHLEKLWNPAVTAAHGGRANPQLVLGCQLLHSWPVLGGILRGVPAVAVCTCL